MPRKPMSEEAKAKARESLARARAAKEEKRAAQPAEPMSREQLEETVMRLAKQVEELTKLNEDNPISPEKKLDHTVAMVGPQGIQGVVYKYEVEKGYYPDPTDRLYDEPKLARFAMRENYIFKWDVEGVMYEKHGVTYAEPRFIVELFQKMIDPETQEWSGKLILVNRQIQHEDELIVRLAADKLGLTEKFETFEEMMNEVRYLRIRQWLLAVFTPVPIGTRHQQRTTQVIDGKVVEVYDTEEIVGSADAGADTAAAIRREVQI